MNENIFHAARNAGYEVFCDPKFLNQYRQVLDNTAAKMAGIVQASGAACGLCFALGLVLVYLVKVVSGSNSALPVLAGIVYSFLAGSIGERIKIHFQSCDDNGSASLQMRLGDLSDEIAVFQAEWTLY